MYVYTMYILPFKKPKHVTYILKHSSVENEILSLRNHF